jgi:hypothetical protein
VKRKVQGSAATGVHGGRNGGERAAGVGVDLGTSRKNNIG